jgi:hypothetical protein
VTGKCANIAAGIVTMCSCLLSSFCQVEVNHSKSAAVVFCGRASRAQLQLMYKWPRTNTHTYLGLQLAGVCQLNQATYRSCSVASGMCVAAGTNMAMSNVKTSI